MRACVAPPACGAVAAASLRSRRAAPRRAAVASSARATPRPRLAAPAPPPALQLPPLRAVGAAALLASLAWAGAAHAADAGFAVGGFAGGAAGGVPDDDTYVYTTRDVAVDLASPLVAYRVASLAFNQEVPRWLDAIIFAAALGAAYVVVTGVDALDKYLV